MSVKLLHSENLRDGDGTEWNTKTFTSGTTYWSKGIKIVKSNTLASLLAVRTAGTVTITYELSLNDSDWYAPVDTSATALDEVATGILTTQWIVFTPQIANYLRFKVVPAITGAWAMRYIQQEEV